MLLQDRETHSLQSKALMLFHFFNENCLFNTLCSREPLFRTLSYILSKKFQFVDQVTRKTFLWSIVAPCRTENFDQQISLDPDGNESYRLTPYRIKALNPIKTFTTDEFEIRFTHADFTAHQLSI